MGRRDSCLQSGRRTRSGAWPGLCRIGGHGCKYREATGGGKELSSGNVADRADDRSRKIPTRSGYYLLMRNQPKAIEELTALVKQYPSDTAGHANLALAHFYQRDMTKALEEQKRAIEIMPQSVHQRSNLSLYALYAGDFDAAATAAQQAVR